MLSISEDIGMQSNIGERSEADVAASQILLTSC
jgi:hypothetical protein